VSASRPTDGGGRSARVSCGIDTSNSWQGNTSESVIPPNHPLSCFPRDTRSCHPYQGRAQLVFLPGSLGSIPKHAVVRTTETASRPHGRCPALALHNQRHTNHNSITGFALTAASLASKHAALHCVGLGFSWFSTLLWAKTNYDAVTASTSTPSLTASSTTHRREYTP